MAIRPLFGTSSSQLMERLLSQALMILQFRWEEGCPPNGCNTDPNKGTLQLWLKSSTCFKLQMTLGFLLDYALGINETHSVLYFSVHEAGSLVQSPLLGNCLLWKSSIHLYSPTCIGVWICVSILPATFM